MTDTGVELLTKNPAPWWWPSMRDVLAVLSTLLFGLTMFAPMIFRDGRGVPVDVDQDLKGAMMIQWGAVMGYYYASSKNSTAKDATMAAMAIGQGPGK